MITTILFVISMVCVINYLMVCLGYILGDGLNLPAPILNIWGWSYINTYVYSPALAFQVYFWFSWLGII